MRQTMKRALVALLTVAMAFSAAFIPNKAVQAASNDVTITLVETSDVHGHMVEVMDLNDSSKNQYRLAYIAKKVEQYRSEGNVILLNGGDSFQGTPVSNFSNGSYVVKAFDAMKYDAHALGNHEFDWGLETVLTEQGTYKNSTTPVLACNIFYAGTTDSIPYTQDYTVVEREGKKVAIIGWAEEYSADIMAAKVSPYTIVEDPKLVNDLAKELKDSKKADVVIVLAHHDAEEAAELFNASYVDFLFGGHSHKPKTGVAKSGIPFAQGNSYGYGYSKATMTISADNKVKITDNEYISIYDKKDVSNLLNTEENAKNLDQTIVSICDASVEYVAPKLNEKIVELPVDLNRKKIYGSLTTPMGNFITDMLLAGYDDVDFAFCNDGGIRCDFEAKDLTAYDIYTVSPFNNLMYKVEMTGEQIVKLLEQIVGNDSSNMQMSGLTAKYDLSREEDDQIFDVRLKDGTPINLQKKYKLVVNEYIATGGNKYSVFLTDIISSLNTNELDNETILASLRKVAKEGELTLNMSPRLVSGKMEAPVTSETVSVKKGKKVQLVCDNLLGTAKVTYKTSNPKVANVSKSGVVSGKKVGTTTITTTIQQGEETYTLTTKVTVK